MIEKQQFRNMTAGFVGAVIIGPKGDEKGVPVAPGETIWLSEPEQVLTANAPRRPEDNPFIAQKMQRRNRETDALEEYDVTPLVAVSDSRYVPANERPVPAQADVPAEPVEPPVEAAPETPVSPPTPPAPEPPAPPAPEPTPEAPEPPSAPPAPTAPTPPGADPARVAPDDEGRAPQAVEDETAAVSPGPASEETGAAVTPAADAPHGEYQAGEEVGTPDAPAQAAGQQPPPWNPESDG